MGITPTDKINRWVKAAGQTGKGKSVIDRVVVAGEFLEKTGRMSEYQACGCLTGIDFSKPVEVVRLPDKVYVQYVQQHQGIWFTDTGLAPDAVGLAQGNRRRKLFRPSGMVHALKSTARSIKDSWTVGRMEQSVVSKKSGQAPSFGQHTQGGGIQYIVVDKHRMTAV